MVDYATRYSKAVPLNNIDTEMVAEALLDMYSRVGMPEDVLSNLGTQYTSDCMKEVSWLLSISRLTASPYYPACNGLVKKFNSTLKQMLRRLCHEQQGRRQPKMSGGDKHDRYLNAYFRVYKMSPAKKDT